MTLDEPLHLEPHRPEWLEDFRAERSRIATFLEISPSAVEHIGSTPVPGLLAKPIIDIMIGSVRFPPSAEWSNQLKELGYEELGEAGVPGRIYFRLRRPPLRNVHVVELGGRHWLDNLALRDYLRASPQAARRYGTAKVAAVAPGSITLLAYSAAKAAVLKQQLSEAREGTAPRPRLDRPG